MKNNLKDGFGVFKFKGGKYKGNFYFDLFHGKGKL